MNATSSNYLKKHVVESIDIEFEGTKNHTTRAEPIQKESDEKLSESHHHHHHSKMATRAMELADAQ